MAPSRPEQRSRTSEHGLHGDSRGPTRPIREGTIWADNISHGELVRDSYDERMILDPANLRLIFQGVLQKNKPSQYGLIPWRIGMLTPVTGE